MGTCCPHAYILPRFNVLYRYWPADLTSVNSHFGSPDDLKALSAALHQRGMYLMLDVVVNHLAATSTTPDFATSFKPLGASSDFHPFCFVTDYTNQTNVEQCWLGDEHVALVDVNTEDPAIEAQLHTMATQLVSNFSADGLRIDTVKHVRADFWPGFAQAAGVFTLGEVLSNDTAYIAPYTRVLDAVLDYSTWFPLVAAFQTPGGNVSALAAAASSAQAAFKGGLAMTGSFLENHDQPRFPGLASDAALQANALVWPFIGDGVPIMYYGQEQSFQGGADPANREALWPTAYGTDNKPRVALARALNLARKAAAAANSSFLGAPAAFPAPSTSQLVLAKPPLLALLTNVGSGAHTQPSWGVGAAATGYAPNTALVDVLACTAHSADAQGTVSVTSSGGMPMVLLPADALTKGGALCGALATGSTNATAGTNSTSSSSSSSGKSGHNGARALGAGALLSSALGAAVAGLLAFA
jgi:alpha-amylase